MKKKDKEFFKEYLTERLDELISQAGNTVSGMTETKENFPDPTDRAALEADRNFMLRIRDREAKLIKKIKSAWIGLKMILTEFVIPVAKISRLSV